MSGGVPLTGYDINFYKEKEMRERSRKMFLALMVGILVATVPAVYAGGTRQNQGTQSNTINGLKEVTIKMYFPGDPTPWDDAVWKNVENLSKNTLNAKFDIVHIPFADYSDKMQLLAASGDNFDLYYDASWLIFPTMLKNGAIMELDDLFDRYAPKLKAYLESTGSLVWARSNGKIMAIPTDDPNAGRPYLQMREDLRAKYNVREPFTTIEDMERYLEAVMAGESNIRAVNNVVGSTNWDNALFAVAQEAELDREFGQGNFDFTYSLRDPKVTIVPLERTEAFKKASQIRARWYEKGWITRNAMNEIESVGNLDQGKYAASMRGAFDSYQEMHGPGEKKVHRMYPDKLAIFGSSMGNIVAINRNAANPERAMMFLEWVNASQANYDAVLYGIKDTTYVIDNGIITFPAGQDSQSGYLEWMGRWAFWRAQWRQPSWELNQGVQQAQQAELKSPNSITSPTAGFTFDTDPVKTQIANRQSVMDQYGKILQYGLRSDVDVAVDDYIQRLNAAGTNEILAELQKQVNAFIAAKK
jgi:putative aldouronate transport system substrate-binding protein